ncbi:MAG: type II toxin-antitoxin system RelE/ParE family toxin [Melioribacteraceae bacterium]|nr:type II toxin-antitoxin system RelE/ParE family toxin [Melioribacteraceae bacterium]
MFKIVIHKRAVKFLDKITDKQRKKIKNALTKLLVNPNKYVGVINMVGDWSEYMRIRVGNIRIVFWLDSDAKTIYVDHIGTDGISIKINFEVENFDLKKQTTFGTRLLRRMQKQARCYTQREIS